ncbi:HAD family hydrolase [Propionibacterium freudenreichii]|uniref:Pyrophosphatase PpaX n=1 Tax=Propionibacterium freudenreichii TaxID=1744 RepID=A0A2C6ZSL7_9ACTN|nr:HAD-IA family hydrolase [Propionibacterium freudenreichii]MCT2974918.1 HAD family hydrolase [Propionibacterium freudenreichii]MDK9347489.1 HAD-IA family hydrolase [Propionibacterium freudenreichii]CUW07292.1 Pyrophosphatase PpaX [Propionibacterium freudenreichii subsp. shermanii]SBM44126.1 Pyrophosphatase PpaX [Propionibacterium freudenreichii]SPB30468.1 Pyrophosphatase PpaX [Propionibacterium freudenreichii subsp. shermanii]
MSTQDLPWKLVLFDLDGTLINSIDLVVAAWQHAFADVLGKQLDRETVLPWIGLPLTDTIAEQGGDKAEALRASYDQFMQANHDDMVTAFAGLPELLDDLAVYNVGTAVVTAKGRELAERGLRVAGYPETLHVAAAMEDTREHKPNPAPLLAALAHEGARASDAVYVGDAIYDLQAAEAAGIPAIGVTWGAGKRDALHQQRALAFADAPDELRAQLLG